MKDLAKGRKRMTIKAWTLIGMGFAVLQASCGTDGTSPKNENSFVVSEYNVDLFNLFTCITTISADNNADVYTALGYNDASLETTIKIVYSVFYGNAPRTTERVIRAEVESTAGGTLAFNQNATKYLDDENQTAAIFVGADVSAGSDTDGLFSFAITSNVAGFTYTDSDIAADVNYSFSTAEGNVECVGSVRNDPTTTD